MYGAEWEVYIFTYEPDEMIAFASFADYLVYSLERELGGKNTVMQPRDDMVKAVFTLMATTIHPMGFASSDVPDAFIYLPAGQILTPAEGSDDLLLRAQSAVRTHERQTQTQVKQCVFIFDGTKHTLNGKFSDTVMAVVCKAGDVEGELWMMPRSTTFAQIHDGEEPMIVIGTADNILEG